MRAPDNASAMSFAFAMHPPIVLSGEAKRYVQAFYKLRIENGHK